MSHRKEYGTEGPLGFPMTDRQARMLDTLLKSLPKSKEYEYRRAVKAKPSELNSGERSDVSWISTEAVDRVNEVVLSRGMNDSQFASNPIVTLNHSYYTPAVGRSLWRKRVKDGDVIGIKAKTQYPARPESWPEAEPWPSDRVFALVQAGLLAGKSIGFLPLKVSFADQRTAEKNGWPVDTTVIEEWLLLEYAVCSMPMNQEAITDEVSKAGPLPEWLTKAVGWDSLAPTPKPEVPPLPEAIPYTSWKEVERIIAARIAGIDFRTLAEKAVSEALDRARGRV